MGAEDAPIPAVLDQLVNVQEAPAPEPPAPSVGETVNAVRDALSAAIVALGRLTPADWDGE
jgi:hypothetical protein